MIIDAMGLIPTTFVIAFYSLPLFLVPIFILHHFLVFVVSTGKYKEKETFSKLCLLTVSFTSASLSPSPFPQLR